MNYHTNQLGRVELYRRALVVGLGAQLITMPALFAQATPGAAPTEMKKQVVTGSNIPTADTVDAVPVDVFPIEKIEKIGANSIIELAHKLPSFIGNGNYGESRANGGNGQSSIALRGVGGGTVVLLNGRRFANSDLNAIPVAAVERIEVLKDGASAIYGADAIAGVVNIILKKNFNGFEANAYYGNTTDHDLGTQTYSFVYGAASEKASVTVGGSFYQANGMYSVDRKVSTPNISDPAQTSGTSNPGRLRSSDPAALAAFPGLGGGLVYRGAAGTTGTSPSDYTAFAGQPDRFPFPLYTPAVLPNTRYNIFGNGDYKLFGEHLEFFSEASYSHSYFYNQLAPTPGVLNANSIVVPANNPFNVFKVPLDLVRYRPVELGPRTDEFTGDIFRLVAGLRGQIADSSWNWESAFLHSQDFRVERSGNDLNATALQNALNDISPATSFNVFGNRANTKAALDAVRQTLLNDTTIQLTQMDVKLHGELFDLPAGAVEIAFGYEHREEKTTVDPDFNTANGITVGFNQVTPFAAARQLDSGWAEIKVPILSPAQDIPGIYSLDVGGAGRFEHYSDFGNAGVPKATVRWQPFDKTFTIRGSYSESYNAPTLSQLYSSGGGFPILNNRYLPESNPTKYSQLQVDTAANPNLKASDARNYTAGIIWSPKQAAGLTVSVDYYRIEQDNVVGGSPQSIINANYAATGGDPTKIDGAIFGSQIHHQAGSGFIDSIDFELRNQARRVIEGVDTEINYELPWKDYGKFTLSMSAAYVLTFKDEVAPGAGFQDHLGDFSSDDNYGFGSIPRLKGRGGVDWSLDRFSANVYVNYIAAYNDDGDRLGGKREIDAYTTVDLQASYQLPWNSKITTGVLNVADVQAPYAAGAFADHYDRDTHDLRGRFVYGSLSKKF